MIKPECATYVLYPTQIDWIHLGLVLRACCLQYVVIGPEGMLGGPLSLAGA